jgi:hypothetical protein
MKLLFAFFPKKHWKKYLFVVVMVVLIPQMVYLSNTIFSPLIALPIFCGIVSFFAVPAGLLQFFVIAVKWLRSNQSYSSTARLRQAVAFVILPLLGYTSFFVGRKIVLTKEENTRIETSNALIRQVENFRNTKGFYPKSIEALTLQQDLVEQLNKTQIRYERNDTNYIVSFILGGYFLFDYYRFVYSPDGKNMFFRNNRVTSQYRISQTNWWVYREVD